MRPFEYAFIGAITIFALVSISTNLTLTEIETLALILGTIICACTGIVIDKLEDIFKK